MDEGVLGGVGLPPCPKQRIIRQSFMQIFNELKLPLGLLRFKGASPSA